MRLPAENAAGASNRTLRSDAPSLQACRPDPGLEPEIGPEVEVATHLVETAAERRTAVAVRTGWASIQRVLIEPVGEVRHTECERRGVRQAVVRSQIAGREARRGSRHLGHPTR
jgi:hypothetical protein